MMSVEYLLGALLREGKLINVFTVKLGFRLEDTVSANIYSTCLGREKCKRFPFSNKINSQSVNRSSTNGS